MVNELRSYHTSACRAYHRLDRWVHPGDLDIHRALRWTGVFIARPINGSCAFTWLAVAGFLLCIGSAIHRLVLYPRLGVKVVAVARDSSVDVDPCLRVKAAFGTCLTLPYAIAFQLIDPKDSRSRCKQYYHRPGPFRCGSFRSGLPKTEERDEQPRELQNDEAPGHHADGVDEQQ